jgi:hypothetical protein
MGQALPGLLISAYAISITQQKSLFPHKSEARQLEISNNAFIVQDEGNWFACFRTILLNLLVPM